MSIIYFHMKTETFCGSKSFRFRRRNKGRKNSKIWINKSTMAPIATILHPSSRH